MKSSWVLYNNESKHKTLTFQIFQMTKQQLNADVRMVYRQQLKARSRRKNMSLSARLSVHALSYVARTTGVVKVSWASTLAGLARFVK